MNIHWHPRRFARIAAAWVGHIGSKIHPTQRRLDGNVTKVFSGNGNSYIIYYNSVYVRRDEPYAFDCEGAYMTLMNTGKGWMTHHTYEDILNVSVNITTTWRAGWFVCLGLPFLRLTSGLNRVGMPGEGNMGKSGLGTPCCREDAVWPWLNSKMDSFEQITAVSCSINVCQPETPVSDRDIPAALPTIGVEREDRLQQHLQYYPLVTIHSAVTATDLKHIRR